MYSYNLQTSTTQTTFVTLVDLVIYPIYNNIVLYPNNPTKKVEASTGHRKQGTCKEKERNVVIILHSVFCIYSNTISSVKCSGLAHP